MYTATLNAWRQNVEPHIVNTDKVLNLELRPAIRQIVREEMARMAVGDVDAELLVSAAPIGLAGRLKE